jgi:arylsulfatase A
VFIDHKTGDNNGEPEWFMAQRGYRYHDQPGELYNLVDDPQQRRNRYAEEPDRVADMRELLTKALDGAPVQPVIGPDPA